MEPSLEIPGYTLHRTIGTGVYSHVHEATRKPARGHGRASRRLALKVLKVEFQDDAWILSCFRREGLIGAAVRHPSLIRIGRGQLRNSPYFHECEAVAGYSLRNAALLPVPIVLDVLAQIASALAALHHKGYAHGDVKPGNILLEPGGRAVLIDLGFARRPGTLAFDEGIPGTPNYIAPELCTRAIVDSPSADVFALGVTAFELLSGELPYRELDDTRDVLACHRDDAPRSLADAGDWPRSLVSLVDALLARNMFTRPKAGVAAEAFRAVKNRYRKAA